MAVVQMIHDGATYNLPKYTLKVAQTMDDINETVDFDGKVGKMYDFVSDVIGKKEAKAIIGDNIEDVDLIELRSLYADIDHAYASVLRETTNDNSIEDAAATIEKLGGMDNVIRLLDAVNGK